MIVLGIIDGYLRYLYKTARLRTVNTPLREILVFRWENVPGADTSILRSFLKERFDISWIALQEFVRSQENNTLTLSHGSSALRIVLDGNYARLSLDNREIYQFPVERNDGIKVYQTISWRSWIFYQSLEDLALLFLAPLLAIAVGFLLIIAGTESKYTLALASLTIGLVTDEAMKALLKFIRRILGTVERGQRDPIAE